MQRNTSRNASSQRIAHAQGIVALFAAGVSVCAVRPVRAQDDLPPAPPATDTTAAKPDPELALTAGELRLDGKVTALTGAGTFVIEATSFTSPSGKQKEFEETKSKKVVVLAEVIMRGTEGPRRFKFADLKLNEPVAVIGKSAPDGSLQARIVVLLDANKLKTLGAVVVSPIVAALSRQAREAFQRGQIQHAIQLLKQATDAATAAGDKPGQMLSEGNLSVFLMSAGQVPAALQCANRELSLSQELGDQSNIALAYDHVSYAQRGLGQQDAAYKSLESGLAAARVSGDNKILLTMLVGMAQAVAATKKDADSLNRAVSLYTEALPLARNDNDDGQVAAILVNTAILRAAQGDAEKARDLGTQVQNMVNNLTDNTERGEALENLGVLYAMDAVKNPDLSKGFWNKALEAYKTAGAQHSAERVQRRLDGQPNEDADGGKAKPKGGDDGGGLMDG